MTRYIDEARIDNIYHSDGGQGRFTQQELATFHDELRQLSMIRIDDLVLGHYLAPNSIFLNRLLWQASDLNRVSALHQMANRLNNVNATLLEHHQNIFVSCHDANAMAKPCLQDIRLYQYEINRRELEDLVAMHGDMEALPMERDAIKRQAYEMQLMAQKYLKLDARAKRIGLFRRMVDGHIDQMNMINVVDYVNAQVCFDRVMDGFPKYVDDANKRTQLQVAHYEYFEMERMYRQLKYHADDLPKFIGQCDRMLTLLHKIQRERMDGGRRETNEKFKEQRNKLIKESHANMANIQKLSIKIDELASVLNDCQLEV